MIRTHGPASGHGMDCFGCHVLTLSIGAPVFEAHYNWSIGQYVNNDREYRDGLKRAAERNSIATGLTHTYEPRYPGDTTVPYPQADQPLEDRAKLIADGGTP